MLVHKNPKPGNRSHTAPTVLILQFRQLASQRHLRGCSHESIVPAHCFTFRQRRLFHRSASVYEKVRHAHSMAEIHSIVQSGLGNSRMLGKMYCGRKRIRKSILNGQQGASRHALLAIWVQRLKSQFVESYAFLIANTQSVENPSPVNKSKWGHTYGRDSQTIS